MILVMSCLACVVNFCRAMLCISAAYAVARCPSVCLSVRPSLTIMDSVETNKRILKFFSPPGSHTILVFLYQTSWLYSDGDPSNGVAECRWVGKNRDCRPISGYRYLLLVPRFQLDTYGRCTFAVAGPTTWNLFQNNLREPDMQIDCFRRTLKTFLFEQYSAH